MIPKEVKQLDERLKPRFSYAVFFADHEDCPDHLRGTHFGDFAGTVPSVGQVVYLRDTDTWRIVNSSDKNNGCFQHWIVTEVSWSLRNMGKEKVLIGTESRAEVVIVPHNTEKK